MKKQIMKKNAKVLYAILTSTALIMGMTGCGNTNDPNQVTNDQTSQVVESSQTEEPTESIPVETQDTLKESATLTGQITAIEGDIITLALTGEADLNTREENPAAPEIIEQPTAQEGEEQPTVAEDDVNNVEPETNQPTENDETSNLTGETKTITVTEDTIITVNGQAATIAELAVEDMVTVIVEGDIVNSIIIE